MKNILLFCLLILTSSLGFSQSEEEKLIEEKNYIEVNPIPELEGFSIVERWAMYPNGLDGIMQLMIDNLNYPEKAKKKKIAGEVIVRYVVQIDGSVGEITIVQSVNPSLDKEAIRIIKLMDKWLPAIQNGKPIKLAYFQPINFKK